MINKNQEIEYHIYLTGRLGNQLFQYAIAKSLQKTYGGNIILNTYEFDKYGPLWEKKHGKFKYDMGNFVVNQNVKLESVPLPWYADFRNPLTRVIKKMFPRILFKFGAKKGLLLWQRDDYIEIPQISGCGKVIVNGWWQDIRYFKNVEEELKEDIKPITAPNRDNQDLYRIIQDDESVCVSIRAGNYLLYGIREQFYFCNPEYFIESVRALNSIINSPVYIVFSDDLEWVKSNINFEKYFPNTRFYYESGKDTVEEKIRLMSSCKHFIISNSTFSWWAQFLSKNNKKRVVAPENWYADGRKCGLYLNDWILVKGLINNE